MTHSFDPTILREYDIRGIVGETLGEADAYALGPHLRGASHRAKAPNRLAVGRDGRTTRPCSRRRSIRGLTEGGIDVVRHRARPHADALFRRLELAVDGGILVTGSHNPPDYNGFKMVLHGRSVFGEEIQELGRRAADGRLDAKAAARSSRSTSPTPMSTGCVQDFEGGKFRIGWDAGNGAAGPVARAADRELPGEHHAIYTEVDGSFPNHHPDPTVEANLEDLKALVAEKRLDFGIAFDGDGDRLGAVDGEGRVIWGDQLLMILAEPVLQEQPGRDDHRRRQGQPGPVRPRRRSSAARR